MSNCLKCADSHALAMRWDDDSLIMRNDISPVVKQVSPEGEISVYAREPTPSLHLLILAATQKGKRGERTDLFSEIG